MSSKSCLTLHTLPIDVVYRILDNLDQWNILCSMRNVCQRINAITDTYRPYKTFTELNFSWADITAEEFIGLSQALCYNTTLTTVILNYHDIGSPLKDSRNLARALLSNKSITKLNLYNNRIGDEGARYFAYALQYNTTLLHLDLSSNQISSVGVEHLAKSLKKNKTLIILNLSVNSIDSTGANHLSNMLKSNKTLQQLDLSLNHICHEGGQYLADALKSNKTLTILNIKYNGIGLSAPWYLEKEVKHNPTRVKL